MSTRAWVMAFTLGLGLAGGLGCSKREAPQKLEDPEGVDSTMLAFLSQARALHHEANLKEDASDVRGARDAMQRIVDAKRPMGAEIDEVLADACARKAELEVRLGDLQAAQKSVTAGLGYARQPGYFRGHMLETAGIVDEALAKSLADAGKKNEAETAKQRALKSLEEAIAMQAKVIERSLNVDGGSRP